MIEKVSVQLTIIQGAGLVAKDKNLFGKKTTSDPYVEVWAVGTHLVGRTATKKKTLAPEYHQTFSVVLQQVANPFVTLKIWDEDLMSAPDLMGIITVKIPTDNTSTDTTQWYDVPPDSAKNASGKLQVRLQVTVQHAQLLVRGNTFSLPSHIRVGLAWDITNNKRVDLDVSCVAITQQGQISMPDSVYYANTSNSNESVLHSGDEQGGDKEGDDESISMHLDLVPQSVVAMYIILTVATPGMRISDVYSTTLRVYDVRQDVTLCTFTPAKQPSADRNATAMFLVRLARQTYPQKEWTLSTLEQTHPTARDFGSLIPHIKSYTRDLVPHIHVDPTERVAIVRKGANIRLTDYCVGHKLPNKVTLGLAWDVTQGVNIDLDASAICLDASLRLVDQVWWKQLQSRDGSIRHHGDEREGDELGDDEQMDIHLNQVSDEIQYIGIAINSFSGQELDDVARAACHLFDPLTELDLATYALTDSRSLDGYTALVMACLYRGKNYGEWNLCIISEAAHGRTVNDNVDELQNYLRRHPPKSMPLETVANEEEDIVLGNYAMPQPVPLPPVTAAPPVDPNAPPKKFIKINGVMKLNPEYQQWNAAHG